MLEAHLAPRENIARSPVFPGNVKILCISDEVDPIVYSTQIRKRFGDVDLVLSAGDLPMEYYDFIVSSLNQPLLFVFGNHNLSALPRFSGRERIPWFSQGEGQREDTNCGARHIGFRVLKESGLLLMGLGGSMCYNAGVNQFTEIQMLLRILPLLPLLLWNRLVHGRWLDILLTHAPPAGIHDRADSCHRGFRSFRWLVERFHPLLMIHGHVHLYDRNAERETRHGETDIINAYGHCVVKLGEANHA